LRLTFSTPGFIFKVCSGSIAAEFAAGAELAVLDALLYRRTKDFDSPIGGEWLKEVGLTETYTISSTSNVCLTV
jgi:hypothetical protein